MKGTINDLEETELKSFLFQFYLRMQLVEERKGYSEQQFFLDIKNTYHDLLEYKKIKRVSNNNNFIRRILYLAIHLLVA